MAVYTLSGPVDARLRDPAEGWGYEFNVRVLRDGNDIGGFLQFYGETVSNQDMRADILEKVRDVALSHEDGVTQATREARAAQLEAALADWSRTVP